jgi:hypothetical protein
MLPSLSMPQPAHRAALRSQEPIATLAGMPAPCHEIIVRKLLVQECEGSPSVSRWVFELLANLARGFILPRHFNRGHIPPNMSWNAAVGRALVERIIALRMAAKTEACSPIPTHLKMFF